MISPVEAYTGFKPRLLAVSERSSDPEFHREAQEALEHFDSILQMNDRPGNLFCEGDTEPGRDVYVAGEGLLRDRGDHLFYRHTDEGTLGLGGWEASYSYDQKAGKVFVEKQRDLESALSLLLGRTQQQQTYTLDLVQGRVINRSNWTDSYIPGP